MVALRWPRGTGGSIVRGAPVYSLVRWDGFNEDKRARTEDLRPETPEDVARRSHEQKFRAWRDRQPKTVHIVLWGNLLSGGVHLHHALRTPEEMRKASAELLQLTDWFAEQPADPQGAT